VQIMTTLIDRVAIVTIYDLIQAGSSNQFGTRGCRDFMGMRGTPRIVVRGVCRGLPRPGKPLY
jgi:hypothetical protein